MKKLLLGKLREIEARENIQILLAVESGRRACGFASPDSDNDARFIYVRKKAAYFRLEQFSDAIELPIDVLDINGRDLQKSLFLFLYLIYAKMKRKQLKRQGVTDMYKIKFITDSASDIPQEHIDSLQIQVMPFPIAFEDGEVLDGVDLSQADFYEKLRQAEKIPTHAQLTAYQFEKAFADAYEDGYDAIIYTCINFKGSNTGNNALLARKSFFSEHPEAEDKFEVHVIDSKGYTYFYGYAVVQAAKAAQDGTLTAAQAVDLIHDWIDHAKILFAPFNLKFARKSGRVSAAAAIVGAAMGIRPVMSFPNGESAVVAKPRGDKKAIFTMVEIMKNEMEPNSPYLVINAAMPDKNKEIVDAAASSVGYAPEEVFTIGGVIAVNAGPDLVGVIYRKKSE